MSPLLEIMGRYWLVAAKDQERSLVMIHRTSRDIFQRGWNPEPVDLEDCRTVICAYNDRLAPTNLALNEPPHLGLIAGHLFFLVAHIRPGVEDLIPSTFGLTIGHMCDWLLNDIPQEHEGNLLESLKATFVMLL